MENCRKRVWASMLLVQNKQSREKQSRERNMRNVCCIYVILQKEYYNKEGERWPHLPICA